MKTALILVLTTAAAFAQGPLTPPGAPAATGKSLTEIFDRTEKRTPISSLPYAINEPGSYYLTGNLSGTGVTAGITIHSGNVTLDLNGFTLLGGNAATPAISTVGSISQVVVRNGHITTWDAAGLDLASAFNVSVENVSVRATSGVGIRTGYYSTVKDCRVDEVGAAGYVINDDSKIRDCIAGRTTGNGFTIGGNCTADRLTVHQTLGTGIGIVLGDDSSAKGCTIRNAASHALVAGAGTRVAESTANNSAGRGFQLGAGAVGEKLNVRTTQNAEPGIYLDTDATATDCTVIGAAGYGFRALNRTTLRNCTASGCGNFGIYASDSVAIANSTTSNNSNGGFSTGKDCTVLHSSATRHHNPAWSDVGNLTTAWPGIYLRDSSTTVDGCAFNRNDLIYRASSTTNTCLMARCTASVLRYGSYAAPSYVIGDGFATGRWYAHGIDDVPEPTGFQFHRTGENTFTSYEN